MHKNESIHFLPPLIQPVNQFCLRILDFHVTLPHAGKNFNPRLWVSIYAVDCA